MGISAKDHDNWEVYSKQHGCKLEQIDTTKEQKPETWQYADGHQVIRGGNPDEDISLTSDMLISDISALSVPVFFLALIVVTGLYAIHHILGLIADMSTIKLIELSESADELANPGNKDDCKPVKRESE